MTGAPGAAQSRVGSKAADASSTEVGRSHSLQQQWLWVLWCAWLPGDWSLTMDGGHGMCTAWQQWPVTHCHHSAVAIVVGHCRMMGRQAIALVDSGALQMPPAVGAV